MDNYTISRLAELLSLHEQTLRKWEKDYSLKIPRNDQGHRYYTDKQIEVFKLIQSLKNEGASLQIINKLLDQSEDVKEQKEQAVELVTLDKLTGTEFKEMIAKQLAELMFEKEKLMITEFEDMFEAKLEKIKEELIKEISATKEKSSFRVEPMKKKKTFFDFFKRN